MLKKLKKYKLIVLTKITFLLLLSLFINTINTKVTKMNAQVIQQYNHRFINSNFKFDQQYEPYEIINHDNENVEMDVRITNTGEIYLFHDPNLGLRGDANIHTSNITPEIAKKYNLVLFDKWFDENKTNVNNIMIELKDNKIKTWVLNKLYNKIKPYKNKIIINSFLNNIDDENKLQFFKKRGIKVMIDLSITEKKKWINNMDNWNKNYDGLFISKWYLNESDFENIVSKWKKGVYIWTPFTFNEEKTINPWLVNHLNKFSEIGIISQGKNYNESLKESGMKTIENSTLSEENKKNYLLLFLNNENNYKDEVSFFSWLDQFNKMFDKKEIQKSLQNEVTKLPISNISKNKILPQLQNNLSVAISILDINKLWLISNNQISQILLDEGISTIKSSKVYDSEKESYLKEFTRNIVNSPHQNISNYIKWKDWYTKKIQEPAW